MSGGAGIWPAAALLAVVAAGPSPPGGSDVEVELLATDPRGEPVAGLAAADLRATADDGEPTGLRLAPVAGPRHLVLFVDLPSAPPADRHRALPALGRFLRHRAGAGDRVTVAALGGRSTAAGSELLCRFCGDGEEVDRAVDELGRRAGAAFRAREHRRTDPAREVGDAYRALAGGLDLLAGDGLPTTVLYLGRSLTAAVGAAEVPPSLALTDGGGVDPSNVVGSVQFLVSLPRQGPPRSLARGEGDRLLGSALEARAAVYPIVAGGVGSGAESWLARQTGGQSLSMARLGTDLGRLGKQLDGAYGLRFAGPGDGRFHRLELAAADGTLLRHAAAYRAVASDDQLAARARFAWLFGAVQDPLDLRASLAAVGDGGRADLDLRLPPPAGEAGELTLCLALEEAGGRLLTLRQRLVPGPVAPGRSLRLRVPVRLPAGSRGLGLALRDELSGRVSVRRVELRGR